MREAYRSNPSAKLSGVFFGLFSDSNGFVQSLLERAAAAGARQEERGKGSTTNILFLDIIRILMYTLWARSLRNDNQQAALRKLQR